MMLIFAAIIRRAGDCARIHAMRAAPDALCRDAADAFLPNRSFSGRKYEKIPMMRETPSPAQPLLATSSVVDENGVQARHATPASAARNAV